MRALIPVNQRSRSGDATAGNQISGFLVALPVGEPDPVERLRNVREQMEAAKRLLLQPGLILPDIAERCGFSGAPTLGRAFLRAVGTTPAAYRRGKKGRASGVGREP